MSRLDADAFRLPCEWEEKVGSVEAGKGAGAHNSAPPSSFDAATVAVEAPGSDAPSRTG